jgi:hypothetical protein
MTRLIISLLVTLSINSCSPRSNSEEVQSGLSIKYMFRGEIDGRYGISMILFQSGSKLEGIYRYDSKVKYLNLNGTLEADGSFLLRENVDGNSTGIFQGKLSGDMIHGVWKKSGKSKEGLHFLLRSISDVEDQCTLPFSTNEMLLKENMILSTTKWFGNYKDSLGRLLSVAYCEDLNNHSRGIRFRISDESGRCSRQIEGYAYEHRAGVANYLDDNSECHLNIWGGEDVINVREYDCECSSGCRTFEGEYRYVTTKFK